jgi:hypothetical protein
MFPPERFFPFAPVRTRPFEADLAKIRRVVKFRQSLKFHLRLARRRAARPMMTVPVSIAASVEQTALAQPSRDSPLVSRVQAGEECSEAPGVSRFVARPAQKDVLVRIHLKRRMFVLVIRATEK